MMKHDDWKNEIKRLMDAADRQPSFAGWDDLLAKTEAAMRESITEWHLQQTLGLYANHLQEQSDLRAAANLHERIGDNAEQQIQYWHVAAGTALARAAVAKLDFGDTDHALTLARKAIRHLGETADPDPIYADLLARLRDHNSSS